MGTWYIYLNRCNTSYYTWPIWIVLYWKILSFFQVSLFFFMRFTFSDSVSVKSIPFRGSIYINMLIPLIQSLNQGKPRKKIYLKKMFVKTKLIIFYLLRILLLEKSVGTGMIGLGIIWLVLYFYFVLCCQV